MQRRDELREMVNSGLKDVEEGNGRTLPAKRKAGPSSTASRSARWTGNDASAAIVLL